MIVGNGRFPVLALEAARKANIEVVAIAIKEEASKDIEPLASRTHWISLGALSKLIEICKREGVTEIMCHPGLYDEQLEGAPTRLKRQRQRELEALTDPTVREIVNREGIVLINYGQL